MRRIVEAEVRRALAAASDATDTPLLAVFFGARVGLSRATQQVAALASDGFRVTALLSTCAEALISRQLLRTEGGVSRILRACDLVNGPQLVRESVGIVVPVLTATALAKVATGITDTMATQVVMEALRTGKPVVAARNAAEPDQEGMQSGGSRAAAPALRRLWASHFQASESYGVHFVDVSELAAAMKAALGRRPAPPTGPQAVITEADVVAAAGIGELHVPSGAIVTPLARDTAAELGVRLVMLP